MTVKSMKQMKRQVVSHQRTDSTNIVPLQRKELAPLKVIVEKGPEKPLSFKSLLKLRGRMRRTVGVVWWCGRSWK